MIKHGMINTPTYYSWCGMKDRVAGRYKRPAYKNIDMDPRWQEFTEFYSDMGDKPEGTSLDRIDNSKGYWPDNCRWATAKQQANNKSNNIHVPMDRVRDLKICGVSNRQIAKWFGVSHTSINDRVGAE